MTVDPGLAPRETTPGGGMTALEIMVDYERAVRERDKLIGQNIRLEDENEHLRAGLGLPPQGEETTVLLARIAKLERDRHAARNVASRWRQRAQAPQTVREARLLERIARLEQKLRDNEAHHRRRIDMYRKRADRAEARLKKVAA